MMQNTFEMMQNSPNSSDRVLFSSSVPILRRITPRCCPIMGHPGMKRRASSATMNQHVYPLPVQRK